ncbi:MAG: endonuclease III [Bacilli bacterium]|nr:endonuclease III [Bacilli bacterium]
MIEDLEKYLDELFPSPKCELNFNKDYELLIAVVLSAQTTDKRVNSVTSVLFDKYKSLEDLSKAEIEDIATIIKPIGTFNKKAMFVKEITKILVEKYDGRVPNDRRSLENLPGVGRKTANVVLSVLFNVPAIAVDTHVSRVSKRLGLVKKNDDVGIIEKKLMKKLAKQNWSKRHHQLVLFGRYHCKAISPNCSNCKIKEHCKDSR